VAAVATVVVLVLAACRPAVPLDPMNTTYPSSLCPIGKPLKVVDGQVQTRAGDRGLTVRGHTAVVRDLDGDGRDEHTLLLTCWAVGANESWTTRVVTVRGSADGAAAALVAEVPGPWGEHRRDPQALLLTGKVLTVTGDEYLPGDSGATGPTGRFTARFTFTGGRWKAA